VLALCLLDTTTPSFGKDLELGRQYVRLLSGISASVYLSLLLVLPCM
jgi:hypothetical protein